MQFLLQTEPPFFKAAKIWPFSQSAKTLLAVIGISLLLTSEATAAEEAPDIFSYSLEELLHLRVTSASKKEELLAEAPSTVTAYSNAQLHQLGYYKLADLANITPGYSSYYNIGEYTFETRGQMAGGFDNNRHLVMIDGIPVNHVRANSAPSDYQLPLYFANQVEFLRGPASALYGVGAFYGVVDIQPLSANNTHQSSAQFSSGNHDNDTRFMANAFVTTNKATGGLHLGAYRKGASGNILGNAADGSFRDYDDQKSLFLYGNWQINQGRFEGLRLGSIYMGKRGGLGNFWSGRYSSEANDIHWQTWLAYGKYQRQLSSNISLNSYLKYNYSSEVATYFDDSELLPSQYDYQFHSIEAQAEIHWRISQWQNFTLGINVDPRYGEAADTVVLGQPAYTAQTPTVTTRSGYAQYQTELPVFDGLLVTAGVRQDISRAADERYQQLSPRVALIQKWSPRFNLKVLYGEALRGPSVKELGVNAEVRNEQSNITIKTLRPETIESLEIAPYYQSDNGSISLTFFRNRTINTLSRNWGNAGEYINDENPITREGLELELRYQINTFTQLMANYSYTRPEVDTSTNIPQRKINAGVLFSKNENNAFLKSTSGAFIARWVDSYTDNTSTQAIEGYTVADFNLNYDINKHWAIGLQLRNLFNTQYHTPVTDDLLTPMSDRALMFSLTVQ